jgi:predicted nucleotidyltransferase
VFAQPLFHRRRLGSEAQLLQNGNVVTLDTLRLDRAEILRLAEYRGAHNLRVFGSVARGEANVNSDLDLLVDWEPDRSLLDHASLVDDLQERLGLKVHIGTERSLHWYARERILHEATPL